MDSVSLEFRVCLSLLCFEKKWRIDIFMFASSFEEAVDWSLELDFRRDSLEEPVTASSGESIVMIQDDSVLSESSWLQIGLQREPCLSLRRVDSTRNGTENNNKFYDSSFPPRRSTSMPRKYHCIDLFVMIFKIVIYITILFPFISALVLGWKLLHLLVHVDHLTMTYTTLPCNTQPHSLFNPHLDDMELSRVLE